MTSIRSPVLFCVYVNVTDPAERSITFPEAVSPFHTVSVKIQKQTGASLHFKFIHACCFLSPQHGGKTRKKGRKNFQGILARKHSILTVLFLNNPHLYYHFEKK